jgi:hypothetical protein
MAKNKKGNKTKAKLTKLPTIAKKVYKERVFSILIHSIESNLFSIHVFKFQFIRRKRL